MTDHTGFYASIKAYIRENPEAAAHVADYVQAGLNRALDEARTRAADMEVALAVALGGRTKPNPVALDKLRKWQGKTSLEWGWLLEKSE
jgi:hypothetical protein